jgi:tRNA (cmo5U34)-methyltransferase
MRSADKTSIPENWSFENESVAENFDAHVREQLPWYDTASFVVKHFVRAYAPQEAIIYDLGCATGNMELTLSGLIEDRKIKFTPVDSSPEMLKKYRGKCTPVHEHLAYFRPKPFDVAISFLTMMFMTRPQRSGLLMRLRDSLNEDGAILLFEKFQSPDGFPGSVQSKLAMSLKLEQGLNPEEILKKEISLMGSQIPLQNAELNGLHYHTIFQMGDFKGILIYKPEKKATINA